MPSLATIPKDLESSKLSGGRSFSEELARSLGLQSGLQTVLIPLTWSLSRAKQWLSHHGMRSDYHRTTLHFHRFMQQNPVKGASYYSKKLNNGVELVYEAF